MTNEKAPSAAGTAAEGVDQTNRQKEDQIVSTIIPETAVERQDVHPDVQSVFDQLEGVNPLFSILTLDKTDALFQNIPDVKRRTKRVFPGYDANPDAYAVGTQHPFWTVVGPDGKDIVGEFPDGFAEWASQLPPAYLRTPNAAARFGDILAISNGFFEVVGFEHTEDGVTVFELCTPAEAKRRRMQRIFEAHPEIQALKPAWADTIDLDGPDDEFDVIYGREVGSVSVSQFGLWDGVELVLDSDGPNVNVDRVEGVVTPENLRAVAADMVTVAAILDEAVA